VISERTKAALAAAKRRGVQLGGYPGTTMTKAIRKAASEAITKRAQARAADLAPTSPSYRWPAPGHCGPSQPA